MTVKSGIAGQLGLAEETTWGLPVAPARYLPLVSEKLTAEPNYLESDSVIAGRRLLTQDQVALGAWKVGGDLGFEMFDKQMGLLLKHALGTVNTTGPVSSYYTHTFTPGDLTSKGLTVQVGRPDTTDGTVHPYTYSGCKVTDWELACKAGENATFGVTLKGRHEILSWTLADGVTTSGSATVTSVIGGFSQSDVGKPISGGTTAIPASSYIGTVVDSNTITLSSSSFTNTPVTATATTSSNLLTMGVALGSASYASPLPMPFNFVSSAVTIAGSAYKTMEMSLKCSTGVDDGRSFLGMNYYDEALENDVRDITGTLNSEYFSDVAYHRFLTGTPAAVVWTFARGSASLTVTANVQFRGSTANLDGRDTVKQELPIKVLGTSVSDAAGLTIAYVTTDATP